MKLELVTYQCANCFSSFDAPALAEGTYGEFLLRSKNGEVVYLNALNDGTYKEVDRLLSQHPRVASLTPLGRAKILQKMYGEVACDPDSKGDVFQIDGFPLCPACNTQAIDSWEYKNPAAVIDIEVASATHSQWSGWAEAEKVSRIERWIFCHPAVLA